MSDNLMDKVTAFGERLKIGGSEVSNKITAGMTSMSFKVKELFQGPNPTDKIVEDATSENLEEPDWDMNLEICDMINQEAINSVDLIRGIKKRIMMMKQPRIQYLALVLLETCVKNCEKAFSEVAAERVLDEMVKLVDDPQTVVNNRNKALMLIEAWGESTSELRYLPVFEETYKSLKARGIRFPGRDNESLAPIFTPARSAPAPELNADPPQHAREPEHVQYNPPVRSFTAEDTKEAFDIARNSIELLSTVLSSSPQQDALQDDLTRTLVQQCRQSQTTVQRIIETAGEDEALLFEALNVNDELVKTLSKYEEMNKPSAPLTTPEPAMIPVAEEPDDSSDHGKEESLIRKPSIARGGVHGGGGSGDDMMDDLDEMIFGKKSGGDGDSSSTDDPKKQQSSSKSDDLIRF
ncbi:Target of Myb protein 1 [Raphanus sativus]|uniref:TOM1-like protein 1 n=2 Tax=Raphanus sativus TaxID=3726 RepID=A0A9W3C4B3_RAPSA|nr:TOM1-like protein 1 [Raphanus sativus]XP_056846335.1 TOM1-like protein 1 [Raphanus sativus]KAJ4882647.1 Target of Myb protein 1 [Raphanus sativus]